MKIDSLSIDESAGKVAFAGSMPRSIPTTVGKILNVMLADMRSMQAEIDVLRTSKPQEVNRDRKATADGRKAKSGKTRA